MHIAPTIVPTPQKEGIDNIEDSETMAGRPICKLSKAAERSILPVWKSYNGKAFEFPIQALYPCPSFLGQIL